MIGETGEIIDWFKTAFGGWRYLFSSTYRKAKNLDWRNEKPIYIVWDLICGIAGVAFSVFLVVGIGYLGLETYLKNENPIGYENSRRCEQIPAGITFNEIVEILGQPTYETKSETGYWYYFNTLSIKAGPIRVRGNKEKNTIIELRCSEDGLSDWIMDRK
ncbi:MAG: hypothetical protein FP814_11455 [Desulfobacterium sp.]|nr:hypothetical protein [Desulfobacterium sp.]MBU3948788.1 hypothetical protein [Pseudomonadota bacterium]MBU4010717.1 hypothetical protein [Pseudomonadota bacterium]